METEARKRLWKSSLVVALALSASVVVPMSAQAGEPLSACGIAANNVAATEEAVAAGVVLEGPLSFSCAPGGVTVASTDADGNITAVYEEVVDDQNPESSAYNQARQASPRTVDPVCGNIATNPRRSIADIYTGRVDFCVIYGQTNSPVNGSWSRSIYNTLTVNLQSVTHLLTFSSFMDGIDAGGAAELSGFIYMRNNQGITPPVVTDNLVFNLSEGASTANFSAYIGGTSNGIYHVNVSDMTVSDYTYAVTIPIASEANTYRFLCQTGEQCLYPDGAEAPIF